MVRVCVCVCVVRACVGVLARVYVRVCTGPSVYACMWMCVYVYVCMCACVCMYVLSGRLFVEVFVVHSVCVRHRL